jgi:hypothetical protein
MPRRLRIALLLLGIAMLIAWTAGVVASVHLPQFLDRGNGSWLW